MSASRFALVLDLVNEVFRAEGWSDPDGRAAYSVARSLTADDVDVDGALYKGAMSAPKEFLKLNSIDREQLAASLRRRKDLPDILRMSRAESAFSTYNIVATDSNVAIGSPGARLRIEKIAVGDTSAFASQLAALGAQKQDIDALIEEAAGGPRPVDQGKLGKLVKKVATSIAVASSNFSLATASALVASALANLWGIGG